MAERCTWTNCSEEKDGKNVIVVDFSNGNLKNTNQLDFTFYKNVDESNPRKKNRRILAAESDRLSYVGNNFSTGALKCNSLCKYYVGVLNKHTKRMEVHSAQLFNMQPVIPGESTIEEETTADSSKTYRERVDFLIEAFGTNKQKRALTSRRLNQVGSDMLQHAVAKAAETVIERKGIEALQQEVAQTQAQADAALYLPPAHPDADTPESVYPFDDILSPAEYRLLEDAGAKMTALTADELQKMKEKGCPLTVQRQLENLPGQGASRERAARCAWYLGLLIKLARQKTPTRKFGEEDGCSRVIQNKLFKSFTVESFNNGRVKNVVSSSMKVKLAAYSLALLLHMGGMTADLTLLHRDLGLTENRMLELAKAMGLRVSKQVVMSDVDAEHRMASLILPLAKYEQSGQRSKRKRMQ